jgi:uncharacterized damage-inducible protein DinB
MTAGFLDHPGLSGPFGALMDEYARAAGELCSVIEALPGERFERELPDPAIEFRTLRSVATHVARSAYGYASALRKARSLPRTLTGVIEVVAPADLRPHLAGALRYTEGALEGFYDASDEAITALRFEMPWGPIYDPEILLEHGIVHLLRHRRQVERWPAGPPG